MFTIIPSKKVEVGHAVIVSAFDRPCTHMIAIITKIDGMDVYARYLHNGQTVQSIIDDCTPISRWGKRVVGIKVECGAEYFCVMVAPSTEQPAVYTDGRHRNWQEEESSWILKAEECNV